MAHLMHLTIFQKTALMQVGCQLRRKLSMKCTHSRLVGVVGAWRSDQPKYFSSSTDCTVKGPYADIDIPKYNLTHHIMNCFKDYLGNTCMVDGNTGKTWTYGQIQDSIVKVASALHKQGLRKGDVVTLFSTNCPEFGIIHLAVNALGAVLSPVNPLYTSDELQHALSLSQSKLLFTVPALIETSKTAAKQCPNLKDIMVIGSADGYRPFSSLLEDDGKDFPENVDIDVENDLCGLPYSSGTTGLPKAVMLSHYNIVSNLEQMNVRGYKLMDYTSEDVFIGVLPLFHIYGLVAILLLGMRNGAKIVNMTKFEPDKYLQLAQDHKATRLHVVPPMAVFLAKHPMVAKYDLSSVFDGLIAAAPSGVDIINECVQRLNIKIMRQGYGMTELSPASNIKPLGSTGNFHTVGPPLPNMEQKVVDITTGKPLGVGEEGEILMKGPNVMLGYYKNPEATEKTFRDGWLCTGDIGCYDEDHEFIITDRLKELIKVKGLQVAPAELEAVLLTHPDVEDTAVIGVPHERSGEAPKAYVVLKPNTTANEESIKDFVKGKVAPYKQLEGGVEFRSEIPKSQAGKILRKVLRAELQQ